MQLGNCRPLACRPSTHLTKQHSTTTRSSMAPILQPSTAGSTNGQAAHLAMQAEEGTWKYTEEIIADSSYAGVKARPRREEMLTHNMQKNRQSMYVTTPACVTQNTCLSGPYSEQQCIAPCGAQPCESLDPDLVCGRSTNPSGQHPSDECPKLGKRPIQPRQREHPVQCTHTPNPPCLSSSQHST
jgi:hypothetical protein